MSNLEKEREVLFPPYSAFEVVEIKKKKHDNKTYTFLYMNALDSYRVSTFERKKAAAHTLGFMPQKGPIYALPL